MSHRDFVGVASFSIVLALALHTASSRAQSEEGAPVSNVEITADGLHRVDPALMADAWLRPEADLSLYTRTFVMPTVVLFREMGKPSKNAWASRTRTVFPVSEILQRRLRETFGESFHGAMEKQRSYEVGREVGRDVVLVQAYLTDVTTGVPPEFAGNNVATVRWIWEANLIVELRDSMSNQILARIRDRERVDGPVDADRVWGLAPQITRQWSQRMVERLDELADFYPSRLWRLQERARQRTQPPVDQ
jgi:hypothetical protein